jgi:hypothetical protein
MLFLLAHSWTRRQRWLIVAALALAVGAFSAVVYSYERYHRGPNESVLFGTWQCTDVCYYPLYFRFHADHNFEVLDNEDPSVVLRRGRWYAGGDFIYLRAIYEKFEDDPRREILIWRIEDITPTELRARMWSDEPPRVYRRVNLDSPHASNKSLEPTAGRRDKKVDA